MSASLSVSRLDVASSSTLHIERAGTPVDAFPGAPVDQKARVQAYINGEGETGGGLAISENGGFFDLNDGYG